MLMRSYGLKSEIEVYHTAACNGSRTTPHVLTGAWSIRRFQEYLRDKNVEIEDSRVNTTGIAILQVLDRYCATRWHHGYHGTE